MRTTFFWEISPQVELVVAILVVLLDLFSLPWSPWLTIISLLFGREISESRF